MQFPFSLQVLFLGSTPLSHHRPGLVFALALPSISGGPKAYSLLDPSCSCGDRNLVHFASPGGTPHDHSWEFCFLFLFSVNAIKLFLSRWFFSLFSFDHCFLEHKSQGGIMVKNVDFGVLISGIEFQLYLTMYYLGTDA